MTETISSEVPRVEQTLSLPESQLGVGDDEIEAARWFESVPENLHDGDLLRPYLPM